MDVEQIAAGFWTPYLEAGHDAESLFRPGGAYRCDRCGSYQIDLSEDLVFGEMRKCGGIESRILARAKSQPANAATLEKLAGEVHSIRETKLD